MTFETLKKLAAKGTEVSTNEAHRTITFRKKGHGHIEATLSKDATTITCRCTPNFKDCGVEYAAYNEKSYLHPVRFAAMNYNEFRELVKFLNNTDTDGKALPKPEPTRGKKPEVELEIDEELEGTIAEGLVEE